MKKYSLFKIKKLLSPTIDKIIFTTILSVMGLGIGSLLYSSTVIFTKNSSPRSPNFLIELLVNTMNNIGTFVFYPVNFISNLFISKEFIVDAVMNHTHPYILTIYPFIFIGFTITYAYLVSCIISYAILKFKSIK